MKSNIRKILQIALTFVMLLSFSLCVACGKEKDPEPTKVADVEISMHVGEVKYLDFYAISKGKAYDITVSDETVISVQKDNGKVSALKVGSSEITQTIGSNTASFKVTVLESNFVPEPEKGEDVIVGNPDLSIAVPYLKTTVGGVTTVSSIVKFVDTNSLVWSVKDANVAKIVPSADKTTCSVIGLAVGSTEVYLSNGTIKDVMNVEVSAPAPSHAQDSNKNTSAKFDTITLNTKVGVTQTVKLVTDLDVSGAVWSIVDNATCVTIVVNEDNSAVYVTGASIGTAIIRAQINDFYAECEVSVTADTLEKLNAVDASIAGNVISWAPVANANGYEFSTDGGFRWENVSGTTTHEIPEDYPSGKYSFMVRAKGDGLNFKAGDADSIDFVTSLYTDINYASKSITWKLYNGVSNYTLYINGEDSTLTSSDYVVNGEYATATLSSLERNEEIYLSANNKDGNKVYHVSNDLGLVVLYSGIGNSNPNPLLRTNEVVSSIVINNGEERPFIQEDDKVSVQNYDGIEFGKKYPVKVVVGGETVNSNVVFVDRVLFAGSSNYVSPEANFVNNENINYYFKNKAINKTGEKTYEYVANDATELVFSIGDVVISRSASELLARKLGTVETVFVKVNEYSVEKVKIGVATVAIENGEQLANLTYVAKGVNTWKNRNCTADSSHVWASSNDVIGENGEIHCPTCNAVWTAGGDRFGKIFSYGQGETFVLKNDIDFFGLRSIYEADNWSTQYSTSSSYSAWGFLGTLDGNGHSVYNVSDRLFALVSNTATIKNLGVYGNISKGGILAEHTINGKVENCYFDFFVTSQAGKEVSAVADIYKKDGASTVGSFTNCFVNVRVDANCTQTVYAIGKYIADTDMTGTMVATTEYDKSTAISANTASASVAPTLIGGDVTASEIKAFLGQQGINHGGFKNDNGVLKFNYTRPEEIIYNEIYPLYKHNETYNGRVANTADLVVGEYTIPASTLASVTPGNVTSVILERNDERIVTANVQVVTGKISTAKEFANMVYLAADTKPNQGWSGYYVLTSNIDMQGLSMAKCGKPGTLHNAPGWGFSGTLDGNGYTVFNLNDKMFYQLGDWVGTIKNLSLINMTKPLATALGGVTIDNCYFQFVYDSIYTTGNPAQEYKHVLGDSVGDAYPRDAVVSNTVIEVINNTETPVGVVNKINPMTRPEPAYQGRTSTLTFKNTIVIGDSAKVTLGDETVTSKPTLIAPNTKYQGDLEGFNDVIWNKEGNFPTFNSFVYGGEIETPFGFGRYTTVDGARVENYYPFVATVAPGVTVTWDEADDILLTKNHNNDWNISPGYTVKTMLKGSDNKFYNVTVMLCVVAINNVQDMQNLMVSLAGVDNYTPGHGGQLVMLNTDLDMTGVTDIVYSKSTASAGSWGFKGVFDGCGHTISNLEVPLFIHTNFAGTIKNVTFKNHKGGTVTQRSSGAVLQNVKFDIDATGLENVYLFTTDGGARMALNMTDCEIVIKNATSATNVYVQAGVSKEHDKGSIVATNVKIDMNDGNLYFFGDLASAELDKVGATNTTVSGSVAVA